MNGRGRPLRFLAVTLGGWTAMRIALWPVAAVLPGAVPPAVTGSGLLGLEPVVPMRRPAIAAWPVASAPISHSFTPPLRPAVARPALPVARPVGERPTVALALAALVRYGDAVPTGPFRPSGVIPPPLRPVPLAATRSRLAGSAWSIVRGSGMDGGGGTLLGGQLGASQAGARLTYALGAARRVALSARVATPLHGRGREAAIGLDWQPTRLPLHLLAEQRVSLDGARGGPTLLAIGGIDPTPVLAGFRLEGYGEGGAIKRAGQSAEAFGDAAARLTHPLATLGPARIDLGAGAWAAGQRGVGRVDAGPTIGAVLPVARAALRVTFDWRGRIAGHARPGSGPALSIGTDF